MIINTEQIRELLDNENISTNQIQNITGFNRKNVWMYRTGRTDINKIQLHTLIKLQQCYNATHDTLMKYKNFEQVIDSYNGRFGPTEIFITPDGELKIIYDGIVGEIRQEDIKVTDKDTENKLNNRKLKNLLREVEND